MRPSILALCLIIPACNFAPIDSESRGDGPVAIATSAALQPGRRAVRIGEGGPGFPACQSRAVTNAGIGAEPLPVRVAPFAEGDVVVRLGEGVGMYVCTRTLDQRWLGVVIPPTATPEGDCGVSGRVERPTGYSGPCVSGWIAANGVRLTGG